MAGIQIADFSGLLVAEVLKYDINTRELEVFIPKLMPGIIKTTDEVQNFTNTSDLDTEILFNQFIKTKGSVSVKAGNKDEPIPEIGSKVLIYFFEENPLYGYWFKFNPNNDWNVIENEKYPEIFSFFLNDKSISINKKNKLKYNFPDFDVSVNDNEINFRLKNFDDLSSSINSGITEYLSNEVYKSELKSTIESIIDEKLKNFTKN